MCQTTLERVNNCLASLGYDRTKDLESRPTEDFGFNSLDWLEFSVALEVEFSIVIPVEDYERDRLGTIQQIVDYANMRTRTKT